MNKITATSGLVTTKVLKTNIWGVDVVGLVKKKKKQIILLKYQMLRKKITNSDFLIDLQVKYLCKDKIK